MPIARIRIHAHRGREPAGSLPCPGSEMTLLCVPLVARTVEEMVADAAAAAAAGADLVEIRLDFIQEFRSREHLPQLLRGGTLPALVTYRFVRPPLARPLPLCFPAMASALGFDSFHRFHRHFRISGARARLLVRGSIWACPCPRGSSFRLGTARRFVCIVARHRRVIITH